MRIVLVLPLFAALAGLLPAHALADSREPIAGPVEAVVVDVMDGDTFLADARIWPGQTIRVAVRIRGIDAPEMRTRCAREKKAARRARARLKALLGRGPVRIGNIGGGKYYGRVLADVAGADGRAVAPRLMAEGLVLAYDGGPRQRMCAQEG